jgi:PhzF family phenazine biosynthesis protein
LKQPIVQVDAFTNTPFAGNPAAVCVLSQPVEDDWMRQVAQEMNLSETAFLLKQADGYNLRWFTPAVEIDLCGHATLASAHTLWTEGHLPAGEEARFHTRSGLLTAQQQGDWIVLNFPATPGQPELASEGLLEALGATAISVQKSRFDYLIELASENEVRGLTPDFTQLRQMPVRGVIVTSRSEDPTYDFVSRFFCPGAGVDEDPVTGSAHCALAPFWSDRLGKHDFLAYQASKRGGVLKVTLQGDRVLLSGQAVTVLRGELLT